MCKAFFRMATLCAVVGTVFLLSSYSILCGTGSYSNGKVTVSCSERCDCGKNCHCAEIDEGQGVEGNPALVLGHGPSIINIRTGGRMGDMIDARDLGLWPEHNHMYKTSVFVIDLDAPDGDTVGIGYIDVFHFIRKDDSVSHTDFYIVNCATFDPIYDYHEWRNFLTCLHYQGNKAIVFPNPTYSFVTVKLEEDYIRFCKVQTVKFELYNFEQELLAVFTQEEIDAELTIPATYISTRGTYFIKCDVTKENPALNEEFTLQFMVR